MNQMSSKQGSALLIVLGLLSFLLISAVAFSISMRTESAAAAAYRRGLLARELLASVFSDARQTLEQYLTLQQTKADPRFEPNDRATYTRQALVPFWNQLTGNSESYGRLFSSNSPNESEAYLLDDAVMRHVPPYIASKVYDILENDKTGDDAIDQPPTWLPIDADIPENRDAADGVSGGQNINSMTIGRMAWTVINLSDSLDINAVGSNSAYRGIGLTSSEFAFDTMATGNNNPLTAEESFKLFTKETTPSAQLNLPLFCSNADLAQYAAYTSANTLNIDNGVISPFSWEDAVANQGDGAYSPFSVYCFWPNFERETEKGDRRNLQNSTSNTSATAEPVSCNEVKETTIDTSETSTTKKIIKLYESIVNAGGQGRGTTGIDFVHMLLDYVDKDASLAEFEDGADPDLYNNAMPTVENVPMISEIGYNFADWEDGAPGFMRHIEKVFQELFDGMEAEVDGAKTFQTEAEIPNNLGEEEIEFELPLPEQSIAVRTYFPGCADAESGDFSVEVDKDSFVTILGAGEANTTAFKFEEPIEPLDIKTSGNLDIAAQQDGIFFGTAATPELVMKGQGSPKVKIIGSNIPVLKDENADPQPVTLTFLLDFYFRVQVKQGSDVVDLCPSDGGDRYDRFTKTSDQVPQELADRIDVKKMRLLDAQFIRITRPVTVTFALKWEIEETPPDENGNRSYSAKCVFYDNDREPKAVCDPTTTTKIPVIDTEFQPASAAQPSYLSFSSMEGAWFAFDPRYNWLSPMLGVRDDFSTYCASEGGSAVCTNFSSPHWVFREDVEIEENDTDPSKFQEAYATQHVSIVPFSWGLNVEDIRYGTNDSGQLLLPAEVGFLPIPCNRTDWTPQLSNTANYNSMSVSDYHDKVAQRSFFRTLPIADLNDGAMDATTYTQYKNLAQMFESFGGENFPEEHRGLVHAFAAQDNYLLAQRLRQLALLGIPPSIKQAAFVTRERLTKSAAINRVNPKLLDDDLASLDDLTFEVGDLKEPKYDTFIADYLFPLPTTRGGNAGTATDWKSPQTIYVGGPKEVPTRPETVDFILNEGYKTDGTRIQGGITFAERLSAYNESNPPVKLGQNDMNTILAVAKECFGDRQQLFLFVLRADSIKFDHNQSLAEHTPLSTARAVALVWRDAYGELPDRVIYYQYLP